MLCNFEGLILPCIFAIVFLLIMNSKYNDVLDDLKDGKYTVEEIITNRRNSVVVFYSDDEENVDYTILSFSEYADLIAADVITK